MSVADAGDHSRCVSPGDRSPVTVGSAGVTYTSKVCPVAWTVIEFLSSGHDVGRPATRLWAAAAGLRPLTAGIGNLALRRSGVRRR